MKRHQHCASRERFLQWTLGKLFLTVEVLEDRQLICLSKRDGGARTNGVMSENSIRVSESRKALA
jgi:hypothetical protein